jgi:ABC-type multidrug transport system ATPase subunit
MQAAPVAQAHSHQYQSLQKAPAEKTMLELAHEEIHKVDDFTLAPIKPIEFCFKNVNIWAETMEGKPFKKVPKHKLILNSVSGLFKAGTATAILGSSGSGKTTLLNYLSSRMEDSVLKSHGELYINGNNVPSIKPIKQNTGYVTQADIVIPELTPREQFTYTARLSGLPNVEQKVNEVIKILGLGGCADTRVGDDEQRGISGGERKRTSIGIELITDPSLLFLDEPTTGLDSKSALDVASLLKKLAQNGRTVITTIHCPSAEILSKFDNVLCLCYGEIVYFGPPAAIPNHFARIGFQAPPLTNPADHLMTIIHPDDIRIQAINRGEEISEEEIEKQFKQRINLFVTECKNSMQEPFTAKDHPVPLSEVNTYKTEISTLGNLCIVLGRCLHLYFRNPNSFRTKIVQTVGFAAMALILYNNTVDHTFNTPQAIQDKGGMIFTITSTQAFAGIFSNMYTFLPALPTFRRESQNKLYGSWTFYITHAFFELPVHLISSIIYLLMVNWVINIRHDNFTTFVNYIVVFMACRFAGMGLGDLLALSLKKIELVNQSFPVLVVPLFVVSGFVATVKSIVIYMVVYSYFSFFRFSFQAGVEIEFDEEVTAAWTASCRIQIPTCTDKNNSNCYVSGKTLFGDNIVNSPCNPRLNYDFYEKKLLYDILILLAQGVFFRIFAMIALWKFASEKNLKNDDIPESIKPQINERAAIRYRGAGNGAAGEVPAANLPREYHYNENSPINKVHPAESYNIPDESEPPVVEQRESSRPFVSKP